MLFDRNHLDRMDERMMIYTICEDGRVIARYITPNVIGDSVLKKILTEEELNRAINMWKTAEDPLHYVEDKTFGSEGALISILSQELSTGSIRTRLVKAKGDFISDEELVSKEAHTYIEDRLFYRA